MDISIEVTDLDSSAMDTTATSADLDSSNISAVSTAITAAEISPPSGKKSTRLSLKKRRVIEDDDEEEGTGAGAEADAEASNQRAEVGAEASNQQADTYEYTVDEIVAHRKKGLIFEYYVKWDTGEYTWEPPSSFEDPNLVNEYFEELRDRKRQRKR
jgi:hypothetical protein